MTKAQNRGKNNFVQLARTTVHRDIDSRARWYTLFENRIRRLLAQLIPSRHPRNSSSNSNFENEAAKHRGQMVPVHYSRL